MGIQKDKDLKELLKAGLQKSISFDEYFGLTAKLAAEGGTTGPVQDDDRIDYTKLGHYRLKRLVKTLPNHEGALEAVSEIDRPLTWLVFSESWCGDAARSLPVMDRLAKANDRMHLRILLRDENEKLMDRFLTRGGRSIPKLVVLDDDLEVLGEWGPRPLEAQQQYDQWKADPARMPYREFSEVLQKWYNQDNGQSIYAELEGLFAGLVQVV